MAISRWGGRDVTKRDMTQRNLGAGAVVFIVPSSCCRKERTVSREKRRVLSAKSPAPGFPLLFFLLSSGAGAKYKAIA